MKVSHSVRRCAAACGVAVLLLAACGDDTSSPPTTTSESGAPDQGASLEGVTLRVGVLATTTSIRQSIGDASGAFDDAPYEIEWIEFEGSTPTVEALNAGAIDVAAGVQPATLLLAQGNAAEPWTAETAPFTVVGAAVSGNDPGFTMLVRADSDIESVADLVGRKVSYVRGTLAHYFIVRSLADAGLDPDAIEGVELSSSEGRAAFLSGAVDVLISGYRNSLPLTASGEARSIGNSGDLIPVHTLVLVRAGLLEDAATDAAVADLLERMDASEKWAADNVDTVAAMYEDEVLLPPEEAQVAAEVGPRTRVALDDELVAAFRGLADVFRAGGVISSEFDVELLLDRRYDR